MHAERTACKHTKRLARSVPAAHRRTYAWTTSLQIPRLRCTGARQHSVSMQLVQGHHTHHARSQHTCTVITRSAHGHAIAAYVQETSRTCGPAQKGKSRCCQDPAWRVCLALVAGSYMHVGVGHRRAMTQLRTDQAKTKGARAQHIRAPSTGMAWHGVVQSAPSCEIFQKAERSGTESATLFRRLFLMTARGRGFIVNSQAPLREGGRQG